MLIRKIQQADNELVAEIIRAVMTEFGAVGSGFSIEDPEVDAMFEAYLGSKSVFYVLCDREQVVGCGGLAQLAGADEPICELKKMYFLPEARGKGLGTLLCETLLVDAARMGYKTAYIETMRVMQAANRLYQKVGFEEASEPLGSTGHCGCDLYYTKQLESPELDPSLFV